MTQPKHATGELIIKMWDAHVRQLDAELILKDAKAAFETARKIAFASCKKDRYTGTLVRGCTIINVCKQCIDVTPAEILG